MSRPAVLWDFDGTLGQRRNGRWGECLLGVLDRAAPGHGVTREQLRPELANGLPWHDHHVPHPHLSEPDAWWRHVEGVLAGALTRAGLAAGIAARAVPGFRQAYLDAAGWELFPDATAALAATLSAGWQNVVVSNHVPELPDLLAELGLASLLTAVVTSAGAGVEKPHAEIFQAALRAAGTPATAWMVGDNPIADLAGAGRLGIPGVLVRAPAFTADYVRRLDAGYGREGWSDWQQHCAVRADDAIGAVRVVLAGAGAMSPRTAGR